MFLYLSYQPVLALTFIFLVFYYTRRKRTNNLPPGPVGLPLLGNALQLNPKKIWHELEIWRKVYGPLVYLNLAGQPVVVVNTHKAATELLVRRATNYSSRPKNIVGGKYFSGDHNMFLLGYGDMWRKMRRASAYALGPKLSLQYQPVQREESVLLAYDMLRSAENWNDYIHRATASSILSIVYDLPPIRTLNDPKIKFMNGFIERMAKSMCPGTYAVEFLPILDHLPIFLTKWKRDAKKDFIHYTSTFEDMFSKVRETLLNGDTEQSNFCANLLKPEAVHGLNDRESAWLAATLYVAGYETSTATLGWIIFCLLLYPAVQNKAHEELDRVVGSSRLPNFTDVNHLPYIRAIIREVMRFRCVTPIAIPHETLNDDVYEDYFIPKKSLCIANVWSINRDPSVYGDDVDEFRPERHLNPDGSLKDASGEGHFTYGFGLRECAGRHVANSTLFIDTATILWAMRIEPSRDQEGNLNIPNVNDEETDGVTLHPPTFKIHTSPRFSEVEDILQRNRDEILQSARYNRVR